MQEIFPLICCLLPPSSQELMNKTNSSLFYSFDVTGMEKGWL
jgi:hypothetical protein